MDIFEINQSILSPNKRAHTLCVKLAGWGVVWGGGRGLYTCFYPFFFFFLDKHKWELQKTGKEIEDIRVPGDYGRSNLIIDE